MHGRPLRESWAPTGGVKCGALSERFHHAGIHMHDGSRSAAVCRAAAAIAALLAAATILGAAPWRGARRSAVAAIHAGGGGSTGSTDARAAPSSGHSASSIQPQLLHAVQQAAGPHGGVFLAVSLLCSTKVLRLLRWQLGARLAKL